MTRLHDIVYPKRLPWGDIFNDIFQHLTQGKLAETLGLGWSSYQRCRDSQEPKHSVGVALLIIHTKYCGKELTNQRISEAE